MILRLMVLTSGIHDQSDIFSKFSESRLESLCFALWLSTTGEQPRGRIYSDQIMEQGSNTAR